MSFIANLNIKLFSWIVIAVVVAVVIAGFFLIPSPAEERMIQLDNERVGHLQSIQGEIVTFWSGKNRLPANLAEVRNDLSGFVPPLDPETNTPYEYRTTGPLSFELCALFDSVFTGDSTDKRERYAVPAVPYGAYDLGGTWSHDKGRVCFSRTIDPERVKSIQKPL